MHRREQIFPEEGSESRRLVKGGAGPGGYVIPEQSAERFPCKRDRGRPLQRLALFDAVSGPVFTGQSEWYRRGRYYRAFVSFSCECETMALFSL